jgi:DNA-binding CsgD family transcriptional regulator/PAS domain-containing protein
MSRQDHANAAIRGFYAAATGQAAWDQALDHLLAATGFDGAAFYVLDRATRTALASRWHRLDESYATEYLAHYIPCDPRAAQVFVPEPRRVLYDYLHTPEAEIDRDPFYTWFQRSQRHRYYLGGQSRAGAAQPLTLTLHRPHNRGHASREEAELFAGLLDHFEHAVQLQHGLALDATRQAARLADQETDAHGVVLLDRHLRVLHANAAARRMAKRGDAILLSETGLAALPGEAASSVARLLADAAKGRVTQPLRLTRRFGGLPYVVTAWPVPAPDLLADMGSVAVAVRILDPDATDTSGVARACALLGLSPQEAAVVAHLVEGADPAEIAASMGLRPATVRTYLAAIYRKTGCHRQGALVAHVLAVARATAL